jgi:hypothetical protein
MLCFRKRHSAFRHVLAARAFVAAASRAGEIFMCDSNRICISNKMLNYKKLFLALAAAGVFVAVAALANQKTAAATNIFIADKGKFTIQVDGQTVAHETFEIAPAAAGWVARGTTELRVPQTTPSTISGTLTLQPDGTPISYEWSSQAEKTNGAHILFANGIAKVTLEMQGARPFEQDMAFGATLVAILDNNLYHQYAILARLYDWQKRGPQTFPVLIPQELTPGSITVEATGSATAGDKTYEGLRATTSDLEVLLYLDKEHRLVRLEVPSAKVTIIRE